MERLALLILEDDHNDAQLMQEELQQAGYLLSVSVCESRAQFLQALKDGAFDLILADYNLPDINGLEALELSLELEVNVPFIFVTGTIGDELAAETVLNGAWGFVLKNNMGRLPEVVQDCLSRIATQHSITHRSNSLLKTSKRLMKQIESNRRVLTQAQEFLSQQEDNEDLSGRIEEQIGQFSAKIVRSQTRPEKTERRRINQAQTLACSRMRKELEKEIGRGKMS